MTREEILGQVRSGEITPDEGESLARANRLPPLRYPDVDEDQADARLARAWSISMCVAWIVWRSFDEVRMELPDFWNRRDVWLAVHADGRPGWKLVGAARPRMDRLHRGYPFTPGHPPVTDEAMEGAISMILNALSKGELRARGVEFPAQVARMVEPAEWTKLIHGWRPGDGDLFYCASDFSQEIRHVEVDQASILRKWPVAGSSIFPGASAPLEKAHKETVHSRLITAFFEDATACPDPWNPDIPKLYNDFVKWRESQAGKTFPSEKTFRRHRGRLNKG